MAKPRSHNRNESVNVGSLWIYINGDFITVRGQCGQTFNFPLADWKEIKKKVRKAIKAEAKRRELADKMKADAFAWGQMIGSASPLSFPAAGMFGGRKKSEEGEGGA